MKPILSYLLMATIPIWIAPVLLLCIVAGRKFMFQYDPRVGKGQLMIIPDKYYSFKKGK